MDYYILCHHGVKGMKWGVRRYQNKDGSLTPAGKKRYSEKEDVIADERKVNKKVIAGSIAAAAALTAIGGAMLYRYKTSSYRASIDVNSLKIGKYTVDSMNLDDIVVPKGSSIFRSSNQTTLRDGPIFVSINKKDRDRYIHRMGGMYKDLYQMTMKSAKDLRIPSEKKQMDLFVDLLTNDESFSRKVTYNPYGLTENVFGNRKAAEKFAKNYHYENFIARMIDYDPSKKDVLSTFVDYAKSKGYDGLIDINDIRTTSDSPILAFDKKTLIVESAKKVSLGMKFVSGLRLQNVRVPNN